MYDLLTLECCECGCKFAIEQGLCDVIEQTKNHPDNQKPTIYCPHGHSMQAKSDAQINSRIMEKAIVEHDNVVSLWSKK